MNKKTSIMLVVLFLLYLPYVSSFFFTVDDYREITIGETIETKRVSHIPQLSFFNPIVIISSNAKEDSILITKDFDNKTVYYERFKEGDYEKLQEYFREVCSPDEEGYFPIDLFVECEITHNGTASTITTTISLEKSRRFLYEQLCFMNIFLNLKVKRAMPTP